MAANAIKKKLAETDSFRKNPAPDSKTLRDWRTSMKTAIAEILVRFSPNDTSGHEGKTDQLMKICNEQINSVQVRRRRAWHEFPDAEEDSRKWLIAYTQYLLWKALDVTKPLIELNK